MLSAHDSFLYVSLLRVAFVMLNFSSEEAFLRGLGYLTWRENVALENLEEQMVNISLNLFLFLIDILFHHSQRIYSLDNVLKHHRQRLSRSE